MPDIKYNTKISMVVTFVDNNFPQSHFNYFRVLLDENEKIPSKQLSLLNKDIEQDFRELYNQYLKIDFDWPVKFLGNCRKVRNEIEVTYACQLPFTRGCYKNAKILNVNEFLSKEVDQYYAEIISAGSTRCFR